MEMIERYIYAVTRELPEKQRDDIEKELRGLIEDMVEELAYDREVTEKDVEEVLLKLGNPSKLANSYRGYNRYLIGPELLPSYLTVLKIVVAAIAIAMTVLFVIDVIFTPDEMLKHVASNFASFIGGSVQGFVWVTIIFAIIEYSGWRKGTFGLEKEGGWKPLDLPHLPEHRIQIKRSDPIASIIVNILCAALFAFAIDLLGVWRLGDSQSTVIPVFNGDVMRGFVPFLFILIALNIFLDIAKLITQKWSFTLIAADIGLSILHIVLAMFIFLDPTVWNAEFMQQMTQAGLNLDEKFWVYAKDNFVYLIILVIVIDIITRPLNVLIRNFKLFKR